MLEDPAHVAAWRRYRRWARLRWVSFLGALPFFLIASSVCTSLNAPDWTVVGSIALPASAGSECTKGVLCGCSDAGTQTCQSDGGWSACSDCGGSAQMSALWGPGGEPVDVRRLSASEIRTLEDSGFDVHEIKRELVGGAGGKFDLAVDGDGNVWLVPHQVGYSGEAIATGINMRTMHRYR